MTKRTILIILGALLLLAIIALAWWWFFMYTKTQQGPAEGFGTADNRPNAGTGSGEQTNVGNTIPGTGQNTGVGTNINLGTVGPTGSGGGVGSSGGGSRGGAGTFTLQGASTTAGVTWLPNSGPLTNFSPTPTNQLNDGSIGGEVVIFGTPPQPKNTTDLSTALVATGIGTALCTAGLLGTGALGPGLTTGAAAKLQSMVGAPGVLSADLGLRQQNVLRGTADVNTNLNANSSSYRDNFLSCITRTIARAAIQQITASTVNWINSGFNGKPSFVQNYQQFFTNVADQAAGAYIQSSALSFLCSPYGPKIRIALAKSYANRGAASCTLSRVSSNIQSFMNGNFNAGGWQGLLQFTTVPTNNPFGAYSYAQTGLANAQSQAQLQQQRNISPGGFIGSTMEKNCLVMGSPPPPSPSRKVTPIPGSNNGVTQYRVCDLVTATPGATIEASLNKTLGTSLDSLNLAKNFDEIINALVSQLMTRTLQGGLANLSGTQGYESNFLTADQKLAQSQGNALLTALQGIANQAGQYGQVAQGSINDIQNAQQQLQELANCHESRNSGSSATSALTKITELEQQVAFYNARITRANTAIALLQNFQTRVLQVTSQGQVTAITTDLNAAQASGALIASTDITSAQQDRTTLQAQLTTRNQQTAAELTQCRAQ